MGDDNWQKLPKFMSFETIDAIVNELVQLQKAQQSVFSVVLHGGEPLLMGPSRLSYLLAALRSALPISYPISLQTNGILISEEFMETCSRYKVSIAVSIDGPSNIHDKYRVGHRDEGTHSRVIEGIKLLQGHKDSAFLNAGLLAVIDPISNPAEIYYFFKKLHAPSVDFLYRDGNHTNLPDGKTSFSSTEYGEWMLGLLKVYLEDEHPLPIRVLDDMLRVILGGQVSKEGIGITDFGILIIDTDGVMMKNDTLKSSYNGADQFSVQTNIKDRGLLQFLGSEEFLAYKKMQRPTASKCMNCEFLNLCGGGMILHRWKEDNGFDNESIYCNDQIHLIQGMRELISTMV